MEQLIKGFNGDNIAILAFRLKHTLPENGKVSRGILSIENEKLSKISEVNGIRSEGNQIKSDEDYLISESAYVSMNLWAIPEKSLKVIQKQWDSFIA